MKQKLYTVKVFTKIATKRFFRDRLAIFFTIAFPLIFLFVFGGIFGKESSVSFNVALINNSNSQFSKQFVSQSTNNKIIKIQPEIATLEQAKERMNKGEIDGTIILPKSFGEVKDGQKHPSGQAEVIYTQNNEQAGQALGAVLESIFNDINSQFVDVNMPFTVIAKQSNDRSLSRFDFVFAGLIGFSILGVGIFGPMNVFPELKKQGILRRLHTTTLRTWQYFLSTMFSQAIIGMVSFAVQFAVAVVIFDLRIVGNPLELAFFLLYGTIMILGIGLALGGWAKNERQVAPLGNIIVFPMMFLSGTFFPRFMMPEWLQRASGFLPLTPVIDGIRLIATEGKTLLDISPQVGMVGAWMVVIYIIAFRVFRWE